MSRRASHEKVFSESWLSPRLQTPVFLREREHARTTPDMTDSREAYPTRQVAHAIAWHFPSHQLAKSGCILPWLHAKAKGFAVRPALVVLEEDTFPKLFGVLAGLSVCTIWMHPVIRVSQDAKRLHLVINSCVFWKFEPHTFLCLWLRDGLPKGFC